MFIDCTIRGDKTNSYMFPRASRPPAVVPRALLESQNSRQTLERQFDFQWPRKLLAIVAAA